MQTKLIIYSLLKSANRVREIPSHLSHQIKGHNGFQKGFPTYPKGFLKASTSDALAITGDEGRGNLRKVWMS